jgi:hypothetical protein
MAKATVTPPETTTVKVYHRGIGREEVTCTVGEAVKFLTSPEVLAQVTDTPARLNPAITRRHVHDILMENLQAAAGDSVKIWPREYRQMMREFGGMRRR